MPRDLAIAAASIGALWALCALAHPAVRRALLDGSRCVRCHADFWRIPALFGLGYAAFQLGAAVVFHARLFDLGEWLGDFSWLPAPPLPDLLVAGLFPAAERTASIFTFFTATFPLSAIFALLLAVNFRGMLAEMARAFRRRFGRWRGLLVTALLLLAALCAIVRPAAYLLLPEAVERLPLGVTLAASFFSFIFELVLGIFFLTYLMLMAYAWIRGIHFQRAKLLHVAMRRTGFVLKWSLPLAALSAVLVALPLDLALLLSSDADFQTAAEWLCQWVGLPLVTAVALACCPVQATLVFHNESLRRALREGNQLLRRRWTCIVPFILSAYAAFLLLAAAFGYLTQRLGTESFAGGLAQIPAAIAESMLAGWLIASWVCLYKNLTAGRKETPF